jgi:hypothetical protein
MNTYTAAMTLIRADDLRAELADEIDRSGSQASRRSFLTVAEATTNGWVRIWSPTPYTADADYQAHRDGHRYSGQVNANRHQSSTGAVLWSWNVWTDGNPSHEGTATGAADAVRQVEEATGALRNLPALRPACSRPGHGFMTLRPFSGQTLEQLYTGPWYDCRHVGCDNRRCRNSVALITDTMKEYADAIAAGRKDPRTVKTRARRVEMFAAKFAADTVSAEPARYVEPTDANLSAAFAGCSRPPASGLYPEIRALFTSTYARPAEIVAEAETTP